MCIVSCNCNLMLQRKLDALLALDPDVAIVQECEPGLSAPNVYLYFWCGANPKQGVGVLVRDTTAQVTPGASDQWAFFLPFDLPTFNVRLLAVWAVNHRAAKFNPLKTGMALPVINCLSRLLGEGQKSSPETSSTMRLGTRRAATTTFPIFIVKSNCWDIKVRITSRAGRL